MVEVKWTKQAIEDIDNIATFVKKDSLKYAKLQVERIFLRTEILYSHPAIGKVVPEMNDKTIKELLVGYYRIIYKIISKDRIDILTVHHSSRLLRNSPLF